MKRCILLLLVGTLPFGCQTKPTPQPSSAIHAAGEITPRQTHELSSSNAMLADSVTGAAPVPVPKESQRPTGETKPAGRDASWWPSSWHFGTDGMTPGENASVFGGADALLAGSIARATGMSSAESLATGAAAGAVVEPRAYVIAKHQATVRQRRIAGERARNAYARIKGHLRAIHTASAPKVPRYIAVDTEKDEHTSPKAKRSVMIWDTESQEVVGNNVYDVPTPPLVGKTVKFDTYSAGYVGTGS